MCENCDYCEKIGKEYSCKYKNVTMGKKPYYKIITDDDKIYLGMVVCDWKKKQQKLFNTFEW